MYHLLIQKIKSAPKKPGVYLFYSNKILLYIGKASNLKNRLQSYLTPTDIKTQALDREATKLTIIPLHSNIEALITESKLIKQLKPRYNVLWRDDKSYFYVYFSKERFPKIIVGYKAQRGIKNNESRIMAEKVKKNLNSLFIIPHSQHIGPFTDGAALKAVMHLLRRSFSYCTCKPHRRICLNAQINNCLGYCCNQLAQPTMTEIRAYQKNIKRIVAILTGKDKKFIKTIHDPYELLLMDALGQHQPYLETSSETITAECYDNSHLSGKEAVGAMTSWIQKNGVWETDKKKWRSFKIRGSYTEDDPRMMHEIVSRRLNHPEWPYPNYIIIDGGITQFRAAQRAVSELMAKNKELRIKNNGSLIHNSCLPAGMASFIIPIVVSFAKPEQRIFGNASEDIKKLIPQAIEYTHNFVIRYHRNVRRKNFIPSH
ncbi:MAG: GIY-YIG nuclease family protein [bacterium]|nr:GIY-YIG nuclease family protein [bacterium]